MVGKVPPIRVTMQECALSLLGETGRKVTLRLECGSVVKLVEDYLSWWAVVHDIKTSLPMSRPSRSTMGGRVYLFIYG